MSSAEEHHRQPPAVQYIPIPGAWVREEHPEWNDSIFQMPDHVRPGEIHYFTKGTFVSEGGTSIIERLPSGHISKSVKKNPYDHNEERQNRESIEREASIYQLIGDSPSVPRLISWDQDDCTLVLEHWGRGDLATYIRDHHGQMQPDVRRRLALQATKALAAIHEAGVVHHDIAPRNFLLGEHLDLCISDFGGSSFPGCTVSVGVPGPRYQSRPWVGDYVPTKTDDIFGLGSVLYFIMAGEEPYQDLEDAEVERRFEAQDFPDTDALAYGRVIEGCWTGHRTDAQEVVEAIEKHVIIID